MKHKKLLATLLALCMTASFAACSNTPATSSEASISISDSSETTGIETSIDETEETPSEETSEGPVVIKEAAVPEEDIVYVNMDGMIAEQIVANLCRLPKHFDRDNPEAYGGIFEVTEPCTYGEVLPKTNATPYWYFDYDADMHVLPGVGDIAHISKVSYSGASVDEDGLVVAFQVPEEYAAEVKSILKDKLLATGVTISSEDDKCIYATDESFSHYYITTVPHGSFVLFNIEVPLEALA